MEIHVGYFRAKTVGEYFVLKRLYKDLRYWLIAEGYASPETVGFPERYFYLSETQKEGKSFYVWWRPQKKIGVFSSGLAGGSGVEFYKMMKVNMLGSKLKSTEIMHQGEKIKVDKGSFEVVVHSMLHFSMPSWEKGSAFEQGLFEVFWKRIYKKSIDSYKKEALKDMYKLQAHMKKILELETWYPTGAPVEPHFGIADTEFK